MNPKPVSLSQRALQTEDQPISFFMQQAVENPDLISLAAGLVDELSFPTGDIEEAVHNILADPKAARAALQYGTTQGYAPLREFLLKRTTGLDNLDPTDLALTPNNVVVTTGSQQLLYLIGETLVNPGDIVITEAPSYFVYHGTLQSLGAKTLSVPMDEDGMRTDLLEAMLEKLEHTGDIDRVKMIYVIDYFQNPSGRSLSWERRKHLMELVRRFSKNQRIMVLEDAAYRELRFDSDDVPSLKSLDEDNEYVMLTMTFSKPCSPGLKTGYGIMPTELVDPVLRLKGNHDFGSSNVTQHLIYNLLKSGVFEEHVNELRQVYRDKRDVVLQALQESFGTDGQDTSGIHWTMPKVGMYVWLSYPPEVNTGPKGALMKAAMHEGILYVPGQFCYVNGDNGPVPHNEIRLCYGVEQHDNLRTGIQRLARATWQVYPQLAPQGRMAEV